MQNYYSPPPPQASNHNQYQQPYQNPQYQQQGYQQQQPYQQPQPQVVILQKEIIVEKQFESQGPSQFIQPLCGCAKNCCICLAVVCIPFAMNYFHAVAVERATKGQQGCCSSFCLDCFCCWLNRGTIRNVYNIEGTGCGDLCTMFWCQPCATLQDYYEVEIRDNY